MRKLGYEIDPFWLKASFLRQVMDIEHFQAVADKKLLWRWAKGFWAPESQEGHLKLERALDGKIAFFAAPTVIELSEPKGPYG